MLQMYAYNVEKMREHFVFSSWFCLPFSLSLSLSSQEGERQVSTKDHFLNSPDASLAITRPVPFGSLVLFLLFSPSFSLPFDETVLGNTEVFRDASFTYCTSHSRYDKLDCRYDPLFSQRSYIEIEA